MRIEAPLTFDRRTWLAGAAGALLGSSRSFSAASDPAIESIRERGKKAGLKPFSTSETEHFVGVGDAPAAFIAEASEACEDIAGEFLKHFREKGFEIALPDRKLAVVVLADAASFSAFTGIKDQEVGGRFEIETNRLVVFDFRNSGKLGAERINSFTLVHESIHQLCYNTGVLDPKSDVPACVEEGLATYAETWRPRGKGRISQINLPRLDPLTAALRRGTVLFPIAELIENDKLFDEEESRQNAYAQSWVLVHALMRSKTRLPQFRAYLKSIAGRRDSKRRLDDAKAAFGDLDKLDRELRTHARRPGGS